MRFDLPPLGLRRILPRTLFGRSLLIIVLPVAVMQIAVTWAFFDAHWEAVTSKLSDGLAGDVAWVTQSYRNNPQALPTLSAQAETTLSLSMAFRADDILPSKRRPALFAALDRSLDRALSERLNRPYWFDTTRYPAYVDIRVSVPGGVLRIIAPRDRAFATRGHIFIFWLTLATLLLTSVAIVFIRNQVRAIERLAAAADAFGRGVDQPAFKPHGAREVRQAAQAFLAMKSRIQRFIDQRTGMLASVSHDLRTPLTRLRLELALSPPGPRIEAMKSDLSEMEHMIDEYLAFARSEAGEAGEVTTTVSIAQLMSKVVLSAQATRAHVYLGHAPDLTVDGRPQALKRALDNLIMNAVVHGDKVEISALQTPTHGVEIFVDDDGPGIPAEQHEEAFKPFGRLDPSRNQNQKGVGLGLAIARDIVRSHGGEVSLDRSPLGGLRVVVRLPG
jgi:two-component system osmolarity sensor histidine kinase EnvZ